MKARAARDARAGENRRQRHGATFTPGGLELAPPGQAVPDPHRARGTAARVTFGGGRATIAQRRGRRCELDQLAE